MPVIENLDEVAGPIDVGELYEVLAGRLEQIVRIDVRAPDVVVEDACQVAWIRLLHHRHRVQPEMVLGWLARTAVHEALKLLRRGCRELPLDGAPELVAPATRAGFPTPHALLEQREHLGELRRLRERQQRLLWMHAMGFSYAEIAGREGCTVRTVDRQLIRARQSLRRDAGA
jgi:RNA polymerase sigma factor (sigma-70 family)